MSSLAALITDLESAVIRRSGDDRARTLSRVVDLFLVNAPGFKDEQVDLFDAVIQRFAVTIEVRARVELAERLARVRNGPKGVIRWLALDEITVARPVLIHSPQLSDQDLMNVALERGRDHMLAICAREALSPPVTDVLIAKGDDDVRHAVVGNRGARLSSLSVGTLLDQARLDDALHRLLGERSDLDPVARLRLVEMAKERARHQLEQALPGRAREIAAAVEDEAAALARWPGRGEDSAAALAEVQQLVATRPLTEDDLQRFAAGGQLAVVVAALMPLTGLSLAALERVFESRDSDLIAVIGKAHGWSWRTIRALLRLRDPALTERHHFRSAEATFDRLSTVTAQRVVHFLKARETRALRGGRGSWEA